MSKSYELTIGIENEEYRDQLVISLVMQGYSVYLNGNNMKDICITISSEHLEEIREVISK